MSALRIQQFVQTPLVVEAFQFTGGSDNAKAIVNILITKGGEATWRPEWLSFERGTVITNPETLDIGHRIITINDWIILKPNILKMGGIEIVIIDNGRFKDQYMLTDIEPRQGVHTENTIGLVFDVLTRFTTQNQADVLVDNLQKAGIIFSEVSNGMD